MSRQSGRFGRLLVDVSSAANGSAVPVGNVKEINVNEDAETYDVTCLGDSSKTYADGLPDAEITFNGYLDPTDVALLKTFGDGLARKWYSYPDYTNVPTLYRAGTGRFSGSHGIPVDGAMPVTGKIAVATPVIKQP